MIIFKSLLTDCCPGRFIDCYPPKYQSMPAELGFSSASHALGPGLTATSPGDISWSSALGELPCLASIVCLSCDYFIIWLLP